MTVLIALCVLMAGFATGCWNEKILEKVGIALVTSIDSLPDGRLRFASAAPVIDSDAREKIEFVVTEGHTVRECREALRRKAGKEIVAGKVQSLIFGEATAHQGIGPFMEVLVRDTINPLLAWVTIAEGEGSGLLEKGKAMKEKPPIGIYANDLLERTSQSGETVRTTVYNFQTAFYTPGLDPVTPLMRASETEIVVVGSALFRHDRMSGRIDNKQSMMLNLLMGNRIDGRVTLKLPQSLETPKGFVTFQITQSKRKIRKHLNQGKPAFLIAVELTIDIEGFRIGRLFEPTFLEKMERFLSNSVTSEMQKTIRLIQEAGCDAIGTGVIAKASWYKQWQHWNWEELYPRIELKASAKVNIQNSGGTD